MPPPSTALITPSQVVGAAIQLIKDKAWTEGQNPQAPPVGAGQLNHAKNAQGEFVRLFSGMADKAILNPDVYAVTAYAAITVVLADRDTWLQQPQLLWDTVRDVAIEQTPDIAVGGDNYLHPLHNLNEKPGQTKDAIIAYLTTVQTRLKATEIPAPKAQAEVPIQLPAEPLKVRLVGPDFVPPAGDEPVEPAPKAPKTPKGKGGRPQPTPSPKPNLPPPKTKSPVKKLKLKEPKAGTKVKGSEHRWRSKQRGPR